MRLAAALVAAVSLLAGCGDKTETKKTLRGAGAYDGVRKVERTNLGKAPAGTLVAATGDAEIALAAAHRDRTAVLVFYRGHW